MNYLPVEGLPVPITTDMVMKAISQKKASKEPGPSGIEVEMIRAAGDLAAAIICDGKVPSDWEQSFIVCIYKGKGVQWTGQLSRSQVDKAGHGNTGEDCGWLHQTGGVTPNLASSQVQAQQMQSLSSGSCERSI